MATTFCEKLIEAAEARPQKIAMKLLGEQVETTTFSEMLRRLRSVAFHFSQVGIEQGDRVVLLGENHPNWAVAYLGILYRGAVAVPLDPSAKAETLANFVTNSESKLAFVSPASMDKFREIETLIGRKIPVVALRPMEASSECEVFEHWATTPTTKEFDAAPTPAQPADMACLMYTSGTTGVPKAVPLTHGNIFAEADGLQEIMNLSDQEVILSLLPMFHAYSQIVNLWIATTIGAEIVYITELTPEEIVRGLKEGGVTTLTGVPRLWYLFHKKIFDTVRTQPKLVQKLFHGMLRLNGLTRDYLNLNLGRIFFKRVHDGFGGKLNLTISAGSSFDAKVAIDYHRLGFTVLQGYGLTETSGAATATRFEDNLIGSVGTPLNHSEVKINEPNAEGVGEVLIRGPIVMPGYYNNPAANAEAFTADGWFRSGDLGRLDKAGHLFIVGRSKDVIVLPSGKNVYPEDVEAHYAKSALVGEVCVLGVRDLAANMAGAEKLCAIIVPDFDYLKANQIANARELIRWELDGLGRELPEYQRVRDYIVRAEPLPRTATRKIKRFELKGQIEASGEVANQTRDVAQFEFTGTDHAIVNSPVGRAVIAAIKKHSNDTGEIHPNMHLELDLGLDSLARAEAQVSIEQALGVELEPQSSAAALTVGDVIKLAQAQVPNLSGVKIDHAASDNNWHEVLTNASPEAPEVREYLKHRTVFAIFSFCLLKVIAFGAKILLRLEVVGVEKLSQMKRPFIVCPNHQSYLDGILVSAAYPYSIFREIFHVGMSELFPTKFLLRMAELIHVVPVDPNKNLLRAMRAGAAGLRAGMILNIYPEGERSFEGKLHPFRKGAAILASEMNVPIVPVALDGLWKVWARGSRKIRFSKVTIRFGDPVYAAPGAHSDVQYDTLINEVKQRIQTMLDEKAVP